MKLSELKQIIRECIEEITEESKVKSHKWYGDYHDIPQGHHEINLDNHGYEYTGPRGGLKYLGVNGSRSKRKVGKYLKSRENNLKKMGFTRRGNQ